MIGPPSMWIFGKEKGQPSEYRLAQVAVCGGLDTAAYCFKSKDLYHLFSFFKTWCGIALDDVSKENSKKMNLFHFFCPKHPL